MLMVNLWKLVKTMSEFKTVKMVYFKDQSSEVEYVDIDFYNGRFILPMIDSSRKITVQSCFDTSGFDCSVYPLKISGMTKQEVGIITGYKRVDGGTVCEVTVGNRKIPLHARYLNVVSCK